VIRTIGLLLVAASASSVDVSGQEPPRVTLTRVAVSADTVELGDRFEVVLDLTVAPRSVAYVPDSLQGSGFEPFGPVQWSADPTDDGGVELSLRYPLIAFEVGVVTVPGFDVFAADAEEGRAIGSVSEGAVVGSFEAFVDGVSHVPSARMTSVPPQQIWVASVLHLDDMTHAIVPRPPADVAGGDRSWPATVLTLLFGATILSVAAVSLKDWHEARREGPPPVAVPPRSRALASLDALLDEGLHRTGRMREFFDRSSSIVRRYVEPMDDRWSPAWTSSELMSGLSKRASSLGAPTTGSLEEEMYEAERVKFGGLRPTPEVAEEHVSRLRLWIVDAPEPTPLEERE
jgi:hypothetical protein